MNDTSGVNEIRSQVFEIFDYLHQNPEVSWKEFGTTRYIAEKLTEMGCKVTTFGDCPGVVGEIGEGPVTIGLRADMDALWQEVDGEFRANHSCGHDAHMTLALGVLLHLKKSCGQLPGKLKFIFQPAEEKGTGALKMIEKKVIDDLDYLYGVHLRPEIEVENGKAAPAIIHGAGIFVNGKIIGEDLHAARPHLGANAIEVAAALIEQFKGIHLDPMVPYSVKMTRLMAGGESANVIPGSAEFSLDLRAQSNSVMDQLLEKTEQILSALSTLYNVEIAHTIEGRVAAAEVSPQAEEKMAFAIEKVLGTDNLLPASVTPGGEDFHFYSLERPDLKATMLGLGCGLTPGLHHPKMRFDREALITGIAILSDAVLETFHSH